MRRHTHANYYHKEHIIEEIQETYRLLCLERGPHPIKLVPEEISITASNKKLCQAIIFEAQKLKDRGLGKVAFSAVVDKDSRKKVRA